MQTPSEATPEPASEALVPQRARLSLEVRAVLLLLFMVLVFAGTALYLMWARGAFEKTQPLYLITDDSEGVMVGMDMSFSGFPIGRVRSIDLAPGGDVRILVDIPIKEAHWLRQSSVFTLEKGLVGSARLRAFTGVRDDAPLPVGAERRVLRGDVSAEIPQMMTEVRDVVANVNRLTADDSALSGTLRELRTFTARLNSNRGGLMAALTGNPQDAARMGELLERSSQLVKSLEGAVNKADRQLLGQGGLVPDAQQSVRQLNALLQDVRQSVTRVDAVLAEVQGVAGNARVATEGLGDLRADVESSLRKVDALITELNRKWPFAPSEKEVQLP